MSQLRNMTSSFVVMYVLIILITTAWTGIRAGYDLEEENLQDGDTPFEKLSQLQLLTGINQLTTGLQSLGKISNPLDLLGSLAIVALGTLQVVGGIVTLPIEIFGALTGFYTGIIPPVITKVIGVLAVLYVGFIILSAKLGQRV